MSPAKFVKRPSNPFKNITVSFKNPLGKFGKWGNKDSLLGDTDSQAGDFNHGGYTNYAQDDLHVVVGRERGFSASKRSFTNPAFGAELRNSSADPLLRVDTDCSTLSRFDQEEEVSSSWNVEEDSETQGLTTGEAKREEVTFFFQK